jgi:ribosomal protein S18 acetylase RimI-like enzyme
VEFRLATWNDADSLARAADSVFDHPVDAALAAEFLSDPRHHLAIAIEDGRIVGMASGVHYVHPDKAPQLFINEVAVAATHHGRGIGRQLVSTLVRHGEHIGCHEAWVLTSPTNEPAKRMYRAAGSVPDEELSVMFTYLTPGHRHDA